jgi:hypothetical protein
MGIFASIAVAIALLFAPAQSPAEADAWESLRVNGIASATQCTPENSRYVDSGEHGTRKPGQYSVWSITDENVFHHFTCE